MTQRTVSVFGSTGSVGTSTVALLEHHIEKYKIEVLSANENAVLLAEQARKLNAKYAVIANESKRAQLEELLANTNVEVMAGRQALLDMSSHSVDWCMMAIVGMAGLEPIFNALPNGKCIAIANKEPLVSAGSLLMRMAKEYGSTILPVDSEHNAIFQVFEKENVKSIEKIILTASGGPFRTWDRDDISCATPAQAIAHPNWTMGAKISVDSASMMNKGLEVIEAHHLFGMSADDIDVIIHPQSIVHSMVEYYDGSVLAQMGAPDMTTPIANALGYPERIQTCGEKLDLRTLTSLTFEQPDIDKFPALKLAYDALRHSKTAPLILNAVNEIAVDAFLTEQILFGDIMKMNQAILEKETFVDISSLDDILSLDSTIRKKSKEYAQSLSSKSEKVA